MPAAPSKCPKFVFVDLRTNGWWEPLTQALSAPTSMGSPRAVPVPWHSKQDGADRAASLSASRIKAAWLGPLGAVRLAERPSWFTPQCMTCESLAGGAEVYRKTAPQPSPRQYPSAEASKVAHRPEVESICEKQKAGYAPIANIKCTPTAKAWGENPFTKFFERNFRCH